MRKEALENLTRIRYTEGNKSMAKTASKSSNRRQNNDIDGEERKKNTLRATKTGGC